MNLMNHIKRVDPVLSGHSDQTAVRLSRSEVAEMASPAADAALMALDSLIEKGRSVAIFHHKAGDYLAVHDVAGVQEPEAAGDVTQQVQAGGPTTIGGVVGRCAGATRRRPRCGHVGARRRRSDERGGGGGIKIPSGTTSRFSRVPNTPISVSALS